MKFRPYMGDNLIRGRRLLHISVFLFVAFLSLNTAIAQSKTTSIVGDWELDYKGSVNAMSTSKKNHYDTLKSRRKEIITDFYSNRTFIFNTDSSYQIRTSKGSRGGSYSVSSGILNITDLASGTQVSYRIKALNKNNLILSIEGEDSHSAVLKDLHFKPVRN